MTPTPFPAFYQIPPSSELQWLFGAAGLVALVIALAALPPSFQMLWGQPKISVEFGEVNKEVKGDWVRLLEGQLYNRPIANIWLTRLGVSRATAEDVTVFLKFCEVGTNRVIDQAIAPEIQLAPDESAIRVRLPPSYMAATFGIVFTIANGQTVLCNGKSLPPGAYYVEASAYAGHRRVVETRTFEVGTKPGDLGWT